jgi:glycosyltransferase involved in cell wall biosynthesis
MDRWPDLCEAVRSAQAQLAPPEEIVLVVDHNRDLLDRCKKEFPDLKVRENREPKGLSGARNSGVAASNGDLVAFLDDDAVSDPGWLNAMTPFFEDPLVLGVGAAPMPRWLGVRPKWLPDEFLWVVGCAFRGLEAGVVRNGLGCAMALRRSLFERLGGFDGRLGRTGSRLPMSGEEAEFSLRAARAMPGAKFIYAPDAVVAHKVPAKRMTFRYFVLRCFAEGICKARVARLVGANSLATERHYVAHILLVGAARGIANTIFKLDAWAAGRAFAILVGLASTLAGYAWELSGLAGNGARRSSGAGRERHKFWRIIGQKERLP